MNNYDIVILGAGIVGLTTAYQLIEKQKSLKIAIIDKESRLGKHTSGRNSGVLHAGIYYKPDTLKARVCISGAQRLKEWIRSRKLPLNECGKIIVPTKPELDHQIDLLYERAVANNAPVEIWDSSQLRSFFPLAQSSTGRCLWSPSTSVTSPLVIIHALHTELCQKGVDFFLDEPHYTIDSHTSSIACKTQSLSYGHLVNTAGVNSLSIAQSFQLGSGLQLLPFKGHYWQSINSQSLSLPCNLYPVPDLSVPFLGVHFTPSSDNLSTYIGPTATPVLGPENYDGLRNIDPKFLPSYFTCLALQYIRNDNNFRSYTHLQAPLVLPRLFFQEARRLIPSIDPKSFTLSTKVGIRPQLYNTRTNLFVDDFICQSTSNTTHVLNAVSPAFTASFELADLIADQIL